MRYWWVNQKQTYQHEVPGGYLWSPKLKANGGRNPYYDFMREVAPNDVVFSFAGARIRAIGFIASHAYEAPKPLAFGRAGAHWDTIGWRVDVRFIELKHPARPADFIDLLRPLLPNRYAPLQPDGRGLQNLYLTNLSEALAATLIDQIGREARDIVRIHRVEDHPTPQPAIGLLQWEEHEIELVRLDAGITDTTREAVILARRGQGLFKTRVAALERRCRITGVDRLEHLRASHCKPWRDSTNEERLDGHNGLLLTPNADHLFDRGFISFDDSGEVLISPVAHQASLARMGIEGPRNVGRFSSTQQSYLDYHRNSVFLQSSFMRSK